MSNKMKVILTILLFITSLHFALAQVKVDTIYVSNSYTSTIVFDKDIEFYDIGNNNYGGEIKGNSLFIKAKSQLQNSTTLLIKYGNDFYNAIIKFQSVPSQTFYDFRLSAKPSLKTNDNDVESTETSNELDVVKVDQELIKKTVDLPIAYKTLGQVKNKMLFSLQNIESTGNEMMVKILIKNLSQFDYEIDFTKFEFQEKKGGLTNKSKRIKTTNLEPLWQSNQNIVKKYEELELYFILPKYTTNFIGKLKVGVWEKNGGRTIEILIPSKYIL